MPAVRVECPQPFKGFRVSALRVVGPQTLNTETLQLTLGLGVECMSKGVAFMVQGPARMRFVGFRV